MGDRTWVEIVVLKESLPQVKELLGDEGQITEKDELVTIYYYEVNDGCIDEQDELTEAGVPYDYSWGMGDNFEAGYKYIRFTPDGQLVHIEYYVTDLDPPLEKLLELVDRPVELVQYIRQFAEDKKPLPWDNQVEYGKRYRTLQLLNA